VLAAKLLRTDEEIRPGCLAAFALNGLNYKRRHISRTQLPIQFIDVLKRHA